GAGVQGTDPGKVLGDLQSFANSGN
ncbi:hypothetical protein ABH925_007599, partial [Streptacidiphilus sp. EB129]